MVIRSLKLVSISTPTEPAAHLNLCHRNPDTLEMVLNHIMKSDSTAGKCTHIQVVKQPERAYPALLFGNYERLKQNLEH